MGVFWWILFAYSFGLLTGIIIKTWLIYRASYNGAILISKESDKTVYSLLLDDYPEKIEFKKEVVLKIVASDESPDRN